MTSPPTGTAAAGAPSRPARLERVRWIDAKHLLLLLLALGPEVSASHVRVNSDGRVLEGRTESSVVGHDGVRAPSCRDLRDAEIILAEREVRLLDQLGSASARPAELKGWKGELDHTKAFLEDVDRDLAAAGCPARPPGR